MIFTATAAIMSLATLDIVAEDHSPSFTDLRLEASILPDSFEADATASGPLGSVSSSGDVEYEDAWRVGIIGSRGTFADDYGLAFGSGGGIQYSRWSDGGDYDEVVQALAATVRLGVVIRLNEMFHVEGMPYAAAGGARGEIEDEESDVSFYWEVGAIVGGFLTLANSFQIGIHGGYLWNGTDLEFDDNANLGPAVDDVEVELRGDGAFFGISLGGRF
jgi:hypothetical protein